MLIEPVLLILLTLLALLALLLQSTATVPRLPGSRPPVSMPSSTTAIKGDQGWAGGGALFMSSGPHSERASPILSHWSGSSGQRLRLRRHSMIIASLRSTWKALSVAKRVVSWRQELPMLMFSIHVRILRRQVFVKVSQRFDKGGPFLLQTSGQISARHSYPGVVRLLHEYRSTNGTFFFRNPSNPVMLLRAP